MSRRLPHRPMVLALILLAFPAVGNAQEPVQLRYELAPGQVFRSRTVTETQSVQTADGISREGKQSMAQIMRFDVIEARADGTTKVAVTYESVRIEQDGPGGHLEYDSSDSTSVAPPSLAPFTAMVGGRYSMVMAPNGAITEMAGLDEMLDLMVSRMDLPPGPVREQFRDNLRTQFGDEAVENGLRGVFTAFPDHALAIGESWEDSVSISLGMPMRSRRTTTVADRRDGITYLEVGMSFTTDPEPQQSMGSMTQQFDLAGDASGTMEIDESTGMMRAQRMEMSMTGTITLSGPWGDRTLPMNSRTITTMELLPPR